MMTEEHISRRRKRRRHDDDDDDVQHIEWGIYLLQLSSRLLLSCITFLHSFLVCLCPMMRCNLAIIMRMN